MEIPMVPHYSPGGKAAKEYDIKKYERALKSGRRKLTALKRQLHRRRAVALARLGNERDGELVMVPDHLRIPTVVRLWLPYP
jgi:hypothetical protein